MANSNSDDLCGVDEFTFAPATVPRQPLVVLLVAGCAGIIGDHHASLSLSVWCTAGSVCLSIWLAVWMLGLHRAALFPLLLAMASLGGAWHHQHWNLYEKTEIGRYQLGAASPICIRVQTLDAVKIIPSPPPEPMRTMPTFERSRLTVVAKAVRDGDEWKPISGNATLLVEGHLLGVHPGDLLQVLGRLTRPAPANNPGEFDFAAYRRTQRQLSLLRAPFPDCVAVLNSDRTWNPYHAIARIRSKGSALLWNNLNRRRAGLASAVLLGERERLEHDRTEAFVETGTIHLLAISGLHVGILVSVLMLILRLGWIPRGYGLCGVIALTLFYAVLTDARPPVTRAAIFITIMCIAMYTGRRQLGFNTLATAALIVLILNPAYLFRVGAQLSFLAVATLICFGPTWRRWQHQDALQWLIASTRPLPIRILISAARWFWRLTVTGAAVWLIALPLVMHHFHLVSPAGIVLTPILYVPVAVALFFGLGVLVFGWAFPPFATVCGWICDSSLSVMESVVVFARNVPGSHFWVAGPATWWLVICYSGIAAWALLPRYRPPRNWSLVIVSLWTIVGLAVPLFQDRDDALRCTFVSVGHGCSILLELPDGKTVLYDAGKMGSPEAATRSISSVLWSRGISHLDAIIISHADADHFNAIPELIQHFSVGILYVSDVMRDDHTETVQKLFQSVEKAGIPISTIHYRDRLRAGAVHIDVLHPEPSDANVSEATRSDNANSIVLAIEYQGRRILLPGDLELDGIEKVVQQPSLDCDVLLAPHHGSRHSQPERFAAWCQPELTIVSSGITAAIPNNVQEAYGDGQQTLLHTAKTGMITVVISAGQLSWDRHLGQRKSLRALNPRTKPANSR
ncbi:MAG: ComEC/Rec2 family competence protein [Pirellulales bacterium]